MPRPRRSPKALAIAVFGARGTGKTAWVCQHLQQTNPARLVVWDFKHDPSLKPVGQPFTDLGALIRSMGAPSFQLRYLVNHRGDIDAQFDLWCRACWAAGDLTMFVDELPEVTKPGKAPTAWRRCVNVGREYQDGGKVKRLSIIGAGQRPAECDKSFIGNCDIVHTGRLGYGADADKMARDMGLPKGALQRLPDLHWVEKRADSIDVVTGVLSFSPTTSGKAKKI